MLDGPMMMGWFWLWPLLVVIGLVLLGFVAYRLAQGRGTTGWTGGSPRKILDQRYARGEINDEEYRRRRAELQ
jgi:putative membrane protein